MNKLHSTLYYHNMRLEPSQKLLLHNVLFHYLLTNSVEDGSRYEVTRIMEMLAEELLPRSEDDDDHDDEDDESSDDVKESFYDHEIYSLDVVSLPKLKAKLGDRSGTLCFFGNGSQLSFEFLGKHDDVVDDGLFITNVSRGGTELTLTNDDGDEWVFSVQKFPKEWTKFFEVNKQYGVM